MKKFSLMILLLMATSFAHAQGGGERMGNGSSGGGHIYGNQLNPWFLQNTKDVHYCVTISPEFSELPNSRVLELIEESFQYWKSVFAKYSSNYSNELSSKTKVGTQNFIYSESCRNANLKFQMGTLSNNQRKLLPDFRQLLGTAYRTSYDEVNLRAKGFVYIAPEIGSLRPLSPDLHPRPWSTRKNLALQLSLIHELGHIFGLKDDHYSSYGIMSGTFVDIITSKKIVDQSTLEYGPALLPSPFGCNSDYEGRYEFEMETVSVPESETEISNLKANNEDLFRYLGIHEKKFKVKLETKAGILSIMINDRPLGSINFKNNSAGSASGEPSPAISLYLNKKQRVFKDLSEESFHKHMEIYQVMRAEHRKNDLLDLSNGNQLKVFTRFDHNCWPTLGTVYQDEVILDIFLGM